MRILRQLRLFVGLTESHGIARRYFVTNGFDGALTMLGLNMGFFVSSSVSTEVALSACLGAAIALAMSGVTSAYVSESAERRREFRELQQAMVTDLDESAHARAARLIPFVIALVNGLAPLAISLAIIIPLWMAWFGMALPLDPIAACIGLAFVIIFLLGVFLGRVAGSSWLLMGLRTLAIGVATAALIWFIDV